MELLHSILKQVLSLYTIFDTHCESWIFVGDRSSVVSFTPESGARYSLT